MQKRSFPDKTISPYLAGMPRLAFPPNRGFLKEFSFYFKTIGIVTIE